MPKVSVIIPTYNRVSFVVKAIDSVLAQTYDNYEIIVVDDGSTDNTREVLKKYGNRIKYFHQDNSGVSAVRNKGIIQSTGQWIAFLDSDDEWLPEYLSNQMKLSEKDPTLCALITNSVRISNGKIIHNTFENKKFLKLFKQDAHLILKRPLYYILKYQLTDVQSLVVRKVAAEKAGLFEQNMTIAEDFDFACRVSLLGPLGANKKELVKIYRRDEKNKNLTQQLKDRGIYSRLSIGKVYEKLRNISTLTREEKTILNVVYSSNMRALGNLLLLAGETNKARNTFKQAFLINPSIKSLSKYIISLLPIKISSFFVKGKNIKP